MSSLFISTFTLIFLAELPDKTVFATLLLATQENPWAIFVGASLAFLVQSSVAVTFGNLIGALPQKWIHLGVGVLFWVFAFFTWNRKIEDNENANGLEPKKSQKAFSRTVWGSFVVIFIAEWGDITQFASASLAARYREPLIIFTASTLALWSVTAIAVVVGNRLQSVIKPKALKRIAAVALAGVGTYFIVSWLNSFGSLSR